MTTNATGALASLSNGLADAVDAVAASVATVHARRRMPASGIIWSDDGLIVTASHVVERDEDISVTLGDGTNLPATLVGRDQGTDIALLKVDSNGLAAAKRAASAPRPGHIVLAIGRPGSGGAMASLGVVSIVGGPWRTAEGLNVDSFIRSDAAMLPGFSGGPLIDSAGDVLGMNSSTLGRRGGLTIPYDSADGVVRALKSHGKVRRGFLGIGAQAVELNEGMRTALGIEQERALVIVHVHPEGPADQSGWLIGDILLSVGGKPVASVEQLQDHLTGDIVGQPVDVTLIRGGQLVESQVIASERK